MSNKAIKMKDVAGNTIYPCPYYPVGSIYMSTNNIDPSKFFGGTWERLKGGFLYGAVNGWGCGNGTGTSTNKHSLTINEMPNPNGKYIYTQDTGVQSAGWYGGEIKHYGEGTYKIDHNTRGGNQGHNHAIPYMAVFIWRRTK